MNADAADAPIEDMTAPIDTNSFIRKHCENALDPKQ
jgi:hypothetical protein